ncbi:MAG: hypothetical protein FWH16_00400 [Oscillospiraceae bacterium]|nr:hypothetical protein [Oscillospiraceae bacterium]
MTNNDALKGMGRKYLLLALGALAGLGLEFVVIGLGYLVFGEIPGFQSPHWQLILHWTVTCLAWSGAAVLLVRLAKTKMGFDIFKKGEKMKLWQWGAAALAIALSVVISYIGWHMNFKVVREFQANGALRFAFQYLYYMVETVLFLLIIVFGQKALESWTKRTNIPWGGIICGLTWGIAHIISRGFFDPANGISSAIGGFMFGAAYLLVNRDIKKAWAVLFLMFVL